jgi:hypothetical protein
MKHIHHLRCFTKETIHIRVGFTDKGYSQYRMIFIMEKSDMKP